MLTVSGHEFLNSCLIYVCQPHYYTALQGKIWYDLLENIIINSLLLDNANNDNQYVGIIMPMGVCIVLNGEMYSQWQAMRSQMLLLLLSLLYGNNDKRITA